MPSISPRSKSDCPKDPFKLFDTWYADAVDAKLPFPDAMTLATIAEDGGPNARVVLYKGTSEGGITFFTNYQSLKAHELDAKPVAALVFHWSAFERQIRLRGRIERVSEAESNAYHTTRPRKSQLGAWASDQSKEIPGREWLEKRFAELDAKYAGVDVPRPPHWGGFRLVPLEIEFWQGQRDRLHDRFVYRRKSPQDAWSLVQLSP